MLKRIAFLQTAHAADDDRVWFHQAKSLIRCNFEVFVIANSSNHLKNNHFIILNNENASRAKRFKNYQDSLEKLSPDIIVCDTPIGIKCASKYKKHHEKCKIVYDVTEWYPSKKNLENLNFIHRICKFIVLLIANFAMSFKTDAFIFGEIDKAKPYKFFFRHKKSILLSYYPDLQYIISTHPRDLEKKIRLFYAGQITEEKGFYDVLNIVCELARRHPELIVEFNVVTNHIFDIDSYVHKERFQLENLRIFGQEYLPFEEFCLKLNESDIFLDLRKADFENNRCLPIKLFYYMAAARPVIYSNLKSIPKGCPEIEEFGFMANPKDTEKIIFIIENLINNQKEYRIRCKKAKELSYEKYNWNKTENEFTDFIANL